MDANNSQTKRGRGRPKGSTRTDKKCDKQLYEAWGSGGYKTKKDVDDEFSLPHGSTFDAYERHRKTLYNEKKRVHGEK